MKQYRLVDRRWLIPDEVEDCLTMDEVPGDELLFVNDAGYFYAGNTLREYFGSMASRLDPVQRVLYQNPFFADLPDCHDRLDLAESLFRNWKPESVPLTFGARDLRERPAWHAHVRSKIVLFLAKIVKFEGKCDWLRVTEHRLNALVHLCDAMGWYDLRVEFDRLLAERHENGRGRDESRKNSLMTCLKRWSRPTRFWKKKGGE